MNRTSLMFLIGCLGGLVVALVLMAGCGGGGGVTVIEPPPPEGTGVIEGFVYVPARSGPAPSRQVIAGGVPLQAGSTVELWDISDPDHPSIVKTTTVGTDGKFRFEDVPVGAGKIYEVRAMGTVAGETIPRQLRAVVPEPSLDDLEVDKDLSAETTAAADAIKEMVKEGIKPDLEAMKKIEDQVKAQLDEAKDQLREEILSLLRDLGIDPAAISGDPEAKAALDQLVKDRLDPTIDLTDETGAKDKLNQKAQALIQTIAAETSTTVDPMQVATTAQNAADQAVQKVKEATNLANENSLVNQALNTTTGTLVISSNPPGAAIYLFRSLVVGKVTTTTGTRFERVTAGLVPVRVALAGHVPVTVALDEGAPQAIPDPKQPVQVDLAAGQTLAVHFELQTVSVGNLEVSSDIDQPLAVPPVGAVIFLDGQTTGLKTPSLFTGLPTGSHEVQLWYAGRTVTLAATVEKDKTTHVKGLFVAELTVNTDIGADVTVKGPLFKYGPETATNGWVRFRLLAGDSADYTVTAKLGARQTSGRVTLRGGDKKTMTLKHGQGVVITP